MEHASEDMQARALAEQKVEAQRVLEAVHSALDADGDEHLNTEERSAIDKLVADLRARIDSGDRNEIHDAVHALEAGSTNFVERRMNASVRKMMAGQSVGEFD